METKIFIELSDELNRLTINGDIYLLSQLLRVASMGSNTLEIDPIDQVIEFVKDEALKVLSSQTEKEPAQ